MKSFIKIALLLLLPFIAKAQLDESRIDSLKQALRLASADSTRFKIGSYLGSYFGRNNTDSSLYYFDLAIAIAEKNNMTLDVASVLRNKGYYLNILGRLRESLKCILQGIGIAEDPSNENKAFSNSRYSSLRNRRLAILGGLQMSYSHLFASTSDTVQQKVYLFKAKKNIEESGDFGNLILVNHNIAQFYTRSGELDSAMHFEQNALTLIQKQRSSSHLSGVYHNIGKIYQKKGDKKNAVEYWHKSIPFSIKFNDQNYLYRIYSSLASFYLDEKNKDSSSFYARKQLVILKLIKAKDLSVAYSNLYKSFELYGDKDSTQKYMRLALEQTEMNLKDRIQNIGEFQKEMLNEQERLQLFEQEKIESKNKLRNYALLSVLVVFLIIGFLLYRNNRQKHRANKILQEQKDKVESTLHELKSTQAQLIQSEKMASLGELTAGIAHEIQNPLNFVNNFSEVNTELIDELEQEVNKGNYDEVKLLAKDIKENEQKINHHGKRAGDIVKGMLQHSSSASGKKEPTDINKLADEYLRLSYHGLRAKDKDFNATMKIDFDETIGNINIIPQDIGRVILNLITNAFYVVNEKSKQGIEGFEPTVSISTKHSPLPGRGAGGEVLISVKDNGNGIPEKILEKIFQPFFTTKPTGQGIGLGLSLSYDIVKAHGGELKVETKEGEGSEFIINLSIS